MKVCGCCSRGTFERNGGGKRAEIGASLALRHFRLVPPHAALRAAWEKAVSRSISTHVRLSLSPSRACATPYSCVEVVLELSRRDKGRAPARVVTVGEVEPCEERVLHQLLEPYLWWRLPRSGGGGEVVVVDKTADEQRPKQAAGRRLSRATDQRLLS